MNNHSKVFVIEPLGGLCNNLRVLFSCLSYCNKRNLNLICIWRSWQNNVNFLDFFESVPSTDFVDNYDGHIDYRSCYEIDDLGQEITGEECFNFDIDYSQLILKPEILEIIHNLPINKGPFISCHVRRGDAKGLYKNIDFYFNQIDKLPPINIHLLTDELKIQNLFRKRYGSRVWFYEKIQPSDHLRNPSPLSTIIDLFLPQYCKFFIETPKSTFSHFIKTSRNS